MTINDPRSDAARKQRRDLILGWAFFAVWAVGCFAGFYLFAFKARSLPGSLITGFMAIFGAYFLWRMFHITADEMKFGVVSLTPSSRPPRPGGQLKAVLKFHDRAPGLKELDAELRCLRVSFERRSGQGISQSEEIVWSERKPIALHHDRADVMFSIPEGAPPTSLPGERRGETGWHSLQFEPGRPLHFHRWEIYFTARVPGFDLERNFPVVIEPADVATSAITGAAPPATEPAPWQRSRIFKYVLVPAIAGAIVVHFLPNLIIWSTTKPSPASEMTPDAPRTPVLLRELLAQTPWTTNTTDWALPMPSFSRHLGIAANGLRSIREQGSERFTFDEIVIEMNPAWSHMDYFDAAFMVTYHPADTAIARTIGGFQTPIADGGKRNVVVAGSLTEGSPTARLRNVTVSAPLPNEKIGRSTVRLQVNAAIGGRKYSTEFSRELVVEGY